MALDETIARLNMERGSPPALRIYSWSGPSVTLGRFQRASDVNSSLCSSMEIPLVRRPTGGRAILHADELTYSFSARTDKGPFDRGLFSCYSTLSRAFMSAFDSLGLSVETSNRRKGPAMDRSPLCFNSTSFAEITIKGKKIIGSAQRRWPGGMLQQGSIPLEVPRHVTTSIFRNACNDWANSLMGLREADASITYESLKEAIARGFRESLGVNLYETAPSDEELELAARLEADKYQSREWNFLL
jgi:lipoate-protein ligase A